MHDKPPYFTEHNHYTDSVDYGVKGLCGRTFWVSVPEPGKYDNIICGGCLDGDTLTVLPGAEPICGKCMANVSEQLVAHNRTLLKEELNGREAIQD